MFHQLWYFIKKEREGEQNQEHALGGPWGGIHWVANRRCEIRGCLKFIHLQLAALPARTNNWLNNTRSIYAKMDIWRHIYYIQTNTHIETKIWTTNTYPTGCRTRLAVPANVCHVFDICWIPNFHLSLLHNCNKYWQFRTLISPKQPVTICRLTEYRHRGRR